MQLDPGSPSFASAYWGAGEGGGEGESSTGLFKPLLFQGFAAAAAALGSRTQVTDDDDCKIAISILCFVLLECSCFHLGDPSAVRNPHGAWVSAYSPNHHGLFVFLAWKSERKKKHP